MGCDIHMYVEYKCGNGMPWQADDHHAFTWEDLPCRLDPEKAKDSWCDDCLKATKHTDYCDSGYGHYQEVEATTRDYTLFAKLAGVRGAGPDPKGLPDDVSEVVGAAAERYGSDGHSHSYLSLNEFRDVLKERGYDLTNDGRAFDPRQYTPTDAPYYSSIVPYCEKLRETKSVDKHILGSDVSSEVQIRLVFWFDN